MKVRVLVEKEVDAEVSLDDVMAEIAGLPEPESNVELLRLLNLCVSAVKRKRPANPGLPRPVIRRRQVSSGVAGARRCGWPCAWAAG